MRVELFICIIFLISKATNKACTVTLDGDSIHISSNTNVHGVAWGLFEDNLEDDGWGVLNIGTNENFEDYSQAFSAGVVEGYLTAHRISDNAKNYMNLDYKNSKPTQSIIDFFNAQESWTREKIKAAPDNSMWSVVALIMAQFDGIKAGYAAAQKEDASLSTLEPYVWQSLQADGDLSDIRAYLNLAERLNPSGFGPKRQSKNTTSGFGLKAQNATTKLKYGRCSALIKVLDDFSDIMIGHSTWYDYISLNRIWKSYHFHFKNTMINTKMMSFSSYPGIIVSLDDFYLMDSGLAMIQTSNALWNFTVYDALSPKKLLSWHRVRLANFIATTGIEWRDALAFHSSGTYVNQYMVLNLNLFTPGQPLKQGLLYVVEEIPGFLDGADMTEFLARGYWPSYNVPFFRSIWERSGYGMMFEKTGNEEFTYELNARAKIFRRDQGKVGDFEAMKSILRYNQYRTDPFSKGDPSLAICARGDLAADSKTFGCIDTKVAAFSRNLTSQRVMIVNGPTAQNLPPFSWPFHVPEGLPNRYNFPFIQVQPKVFVEGA